MDHGAAEFRDSPVTCGDSTKFGRKVNFRKIKRPTWYSRAIRRLEVTLQRAEEGRDRQRFLH